MEYLLASTGVLLLLGIAGFIASGIALAWPERASVGPPPAPLQARDVTIPSPSGSTLRGWLVRGDSGGGALVLLHGVRADRRQMIERMRFLRDAGYSLLAIDFQAHGESPGRFITFGRLEALDAEAALAFARVRFPGERVGVIGVSLGGAAALLGPQPVPADALVLESVYPDIRSAIANRIATYLGPLAGRVLVLGYLELMPPILGVGKDQLRPIDHIGEVRAPIFVMSGTADRYTTIAESRALFERAPGLKQFWAVDGAAHVDLAAYAPEEYRKAVLAFLAKHLRGATGATPN